MEGIDIEQLRAEVLRRHDLALGKDDPIFASVAIHDLVLGHYLERAEKSAAELERKGAQMMAQEIAAVKTAAETMIAGAAKYLASEVQSASAQARKDLVTEVVAALDRRDMMQHASDAKRSADTLRLAVFAGVGGLVSVALVLVVWLLAK